MQRSAAFAVITITAGLLAPPLVGAAGAAPHPKVAATGTTHCTITGKVSFEPAVRATTTAATVKLAGKLTGCTNANEGAIVGGTLKGTAVAAPDATCAALTDPIDSSIALTIKWKTQKPTPKLLDTSAVAATGENSTDETTGAVVADTVAGTMPSGSFVSENVTLHLVFDATAASIATGCSAKHATHSMKFTGLNGASTLDVGTPANPPCEGNFTVDAVNGNDTNAGDCHAPFKTITHALTLATAGQEIVVEPGTYDTANGETFPLTVPAGVQLTGDATNFPGVQTSRGTSPATKIVGAVDLATASSLSDLWIDGGVTTADSSAIVFSTITTGTGGAMICVTLGDGSAIVESSTITGCGNGISVTGTAAAQIDQSTITANTVVGVEVGPSASADLGGATMGIAGGNTLSCSGLADLYVSGAASARNDAWDHNPPTLLLGGSPSGGVDVFAATALPSTTGATVAATPCP